MSDELFLVIDMQKDFVDGSLGTKEAVEIVPNVVKAVEIAKKREAKLFFTKDTHYEDYLQHTLEGKYLPVLHCVCNTPGWEVIPELKPYEVPAKNVIRKDTFGVTHWIHYLGVWNPEVITLCGVCTDICVISNALILKAEYSASRVRVIEDATAGVTPELKQKALDTMKSCQVEVISLEEFANDSNK